MTDPSYLSCVALHGFKMVAKLFDRGKEGWVRVDLINVHVSNVTHHTGSRHSRTYFTKKTLLTLDLELELCADCFLHARFVKLLENGVNLKGQYISQRICRQQQLGARTFLFNLFLSASAALALRSSSSSFSLSFASSVSSRLISACSSRIELVAAANWLSSALYIVPARVSFHQVPINDPKARR